MEGVHTKKTKNSEQHNSFTFETASLEERQRESSHSGIKSTHINLVKDKSLSQMVRRRGRRLLEGADFLFGRFKKINKCEFQTAVEDNQSSRNMASHGPEDVAGPTL